MKKENGAEKLNNREKNEKNNEEKSRISVAQRGRGRPPKPIDVHAALELTLWGTSFREQARLAGCSARTLMGCYAEEIERAEAYISGLLKRRLFRLAIVEDNVEALIFLLDQGIYDTKNNRKTKQPTLGGRKWTRREFQQAQRIILRSRVPKSKSNYKYWRVPRYQKWPPKNSSRRPTLFNPCCLTPFNEGGK